MAKGILKPLFTVILAAALGTGCVPPWLADLNAAYKKEITACVEKATSSKESCECRKDVDERYGICKWTQRPWPEISRCDVECR